MMGAQCQYAHTFGRQICSSTLALGASASSVRAFIALSLTSELISLSRGTNFSRAEASKTAYFPLVITAMLEKTNPDYKNNAVLALYS